MFQEIVQGVKGAADNFTGGGGGAEFSPLNATSYNPGVFLFLMKGLIRRKGLIESENVAYILHSYAIITFQ